MKIWARRYFLAATGAAAANLVVLRGLSPTSNELLIQVVKDLKLSPAVGRAYLEKADSKLTPEELVTLIRERLSLEASVESLNRNDLTQLLASAIQDDFDSDASIFQLDGWYLSLTECRLAALKYLLDPQVVREVEEPDSEFSAGLLADVIDWGPRSAVVGEPFNPQPDGSSAIWLETNSEVSGDLRLYLGKFQLTTQAQGRRLLGTLAPAATHQFLSLSGSHPLMLVSLEQRLHQKVGDFEVVLKPAGASLGCVVPRQGSPDLL